MSDNWKIPIGIGATVTAASYGTAYYFFRRTIIRNNAKNDRTINMAGTNWDTYMPFLKERGKWLDEQPKEDVSISSKDGLKLHGTFLPVEGSKKIVLCCHGYTSKGLSDFIGLSKFYITQGYQMLLADARAHGESEGTYIGFGCLDRFDVLEWIKYLIQRCGEDCEIILHGISMGAATLLMVSGLDLPSNIKGIISDCAFTSAWDMFQSVLHNMYHLPAFPILYISDRMTKKKAGYGLAECNSAEEVKKAKVPILFIHGNGDSFVPSRMCHEIYNNCASPKDILIVEGAGHAESYYKETKNYEDKMKSFLKIEGEPHHEN